MRRILNHPLFLAAFLLAAPAVAAAAPTTLVNPLGTNDIRIVIGTIIKGLLGISSVVALMMFVWGGMLWVTSGGNGERVKKGKDTLIWATIGLVVLFAAYALVNAVIGVISGAGAT
jgi:hypothetical protein